MYQRCKKNWNLYCRFSTLQSTKYCSQKYSLLRVNYIKIFKKASVFNLKDKYVYGISDVLETSLKYAIMEKQATEEH